MQTLETRIMIYTSKYNESKNFYQEVLGFKEIKSFETGAMLESGSSIIEIFDHSDLVQTKVKLSFKIDDILSLWDEVMPLVKISHNLRFNSWGDT